MAFIGNTPTTQAFTPAVDYFSGTGSATAFTLSRPVASVAQVQVVIDNVAQNPSSAYTISGSTITFTSAPLSGTNNIYVYYTSPITQVIAPGQGTVGNTQMVSGAAVANIGYTPVNKAGDSMTGDLSNTGKFTGTGSGGGGVRVYGGSGAHQWDIYGNGNNLRFSDNTGSGYVQVDGNINFGISNAGIVFNNSSASVNSTLNDYEVGTWTVTDQSGAGLSITTNRANYIKIGRLVFCVASINYPSTSNSASAYLSLPFANGITTYYGGGGYMNYSNNGSFYIPVVENTGTKNLFYNAAASAYTNAQFSGFRLDYTIIYYASF